MAAKISAFLITFLLNVAFAAVILFFMLLAMNGYSESTAMWGLGAYVILALLVSLAMGIGAYFLTGRLTKRQFSPLGATAVAVPVLAGLGVVLEIICSVIGVGVAEFLRVKF